jgi:hypothetical protein
MYGIVLIILFFASFPCFQTNRNRHGDVLGRAAGPARRVCRDLDHAVGVGRGEGKGRVAGGAILPGGGDVDGAEPADGGEGGEGEVRCAEGRGEGEIVIDKIP